MPGEPEARGVGDADQDRLVAEPAWTTQQSHIDQLASSLQSHIGQLASSLQSHIGQLASSLTAIVDPIARVRAADAWADHARTLQSQIGNIRRRAIYEATLRPGRTGDSVAVELGVSPKSVSVSIATFRAEDRELFGAALRLLMRPGVCEIPGDRLAWGLHARDVLVPAQLVLDVAAQGYDPSGLDGPDTTLLATAVARAGEVLRSAGVLPALPEQPVAAPPAPGAVFAVGPSKQPGADGSLLMRRRAEAPSIHDVAAAAGVSYQTVSRVLNNSPRVSPDTRRTVLEAIERLGYRPNRAARALGLGRAAAVTVVTSDTMLYGYASTLQGVEEAARAAGMAVGVRVVESASDTDVQQAVDYVSDPSAGGVVVIAFDPAGRRVLEALSPDVPTIAAIEPAAAPDTSRLAICLDERMAAAEATQHLLDLGHRTVHHVAIPSEARPSVRQAGWRDALERAKAPVPAVIPAGWDPRAAYRAGLRLAEDPRVTAVLCGNDDLALGVRRALFEAGRDVPGDVSIVGFDDIPGAALWTPALTTVRMDFAGLGRACFAGVVALLSGSPPPEAVLAAPRLTVRESTAAPRSSGT